MSTTFSSLPTVSLSVLSSPSPTLAQLTALASQLNQVFSTTGFAYLTDVPLTFSHNEIFGICNEFFGPEGFSAEEKMSLAKTTFVKNNQNTYRGYFPPQPGADNLKEGFELGTPLARKSQPLAGIKFNLTEANVFPASRPSFRNRCEALHGELQALSARLLSLLAMALGKNPSFFDSYLQDSLSTLRLLHYPPVPQARQQELICTPHTDSGILTLLHQDTTGGLEVRDSEGRWISAPYVPGSIVINIGDLLAKVSGGKWVATYHRVRSAQQGDGKDSIGRYSVPFFFEPGANCVVKSVEGHEVIYGEHILEKMKGWVEFQDMKEEELVESLEAHNSLVEAF